MSSDEEPYSMDFEKDESSATSAPVMKNKDSAAAATKAASSTSGRNVSDKPRSKSKSRSDDSSTTSYEGLSREGQGSGLKKLNPTRTSKHQESENSVDEMDSFSVDLTNSPPPAPSNNKNTTTDATTKELSTADILRKLEKLEQAQNELEEAIGLSEIDEEGESQASHLSHSAAFSLPSNSHSASVSKSYSDKPRSQRKPQSEDGISNSVSSGLDEIYKMIEGMEKDIPRKTDSNAAPESQSRPGTADRSLDEVFQEYDDIEKRLTRTDVGAGDADAQIFSMSDQVLKFAGSRKKKSPYETGFGSAAASVQMQLKENARPEPSLPKSSIKVATSSSNEPSGVIGHLPPKAPSKSKAINTKTTVVVPATNQTPLIEQTHIGGYPEKTKLLTRSSSSEKSKSKSSSYETPSKKAKSILPPSESEVPPLPVPRSIHSISGMDANSNSKKYEELGQNMNKERQELFVTGVISRESQRLEQMRTEIEKLAALNESYQKENDKLYTQIKTSQEEARTKEYDLLNEVNRLKTEIATVKLSNLPPKPDNSCQLIKKEELNHLKAELNSKAQQVVELHREITRLKHEAARPKSAGSVKLPRQNVVVMSEEKEKEYQKNIRGLQKQVRTLQKIMYHKDPSAGMASSLTSDLLKFGSTEKGLDLNLPEDIIDRNQQLQVVENRVFELEKELARADSASNEKLKEFQLKFTSLKSKYEDRITDLERKLAESENRTKAPELLLLQESNSKYERSQAEIAQLKLEISKFKRELEIAAKSNAVSSSVQASASAKQDAGTLSLAIKSFKVELGEKDKELIRTRKEVADLRKTNLHLKREREKYLTSTNTNMTLLSRSSVMNRAKSDLVPSAAPPNSTANQRRRASEMPKKPNSAGSVPKLDSCTIQMLQATLDSERSEFEEIIIKKNSLIEEREKMISELKHKIRSVEAPIVDSRDSDADLALLEQLRSRVSTQNQVIEALKNHITSMQNEIISLKNEKGMLEFRVRELNQQLTLANTLRKPENEILADLSEKVDNLNSRYLYREKQLDLLLKVASKGKSYTSSLVNGFVLGNVPLEPDMGLLSPTTSMHLLTDPTDNNDI